MASGKGTGRFSANEGDDEDEPEMILSGRRLSDVRTPTGAQASVFISRTLARSPERSGKRPRKESESDKELDDATGNRLHCDSKYLLSTMSTFMREMKGKMAKEHTDFLVNWNSKFSDYHKNLWTYVRRLEGKYVAMKEMTGSVISEAVKDALRSAQLSHECPPAQLSPILRKMDGIRDEIHSQMKAPLSGGDIQQSFMDAMRVLDEKMMKQGQQLSNQVHSCTQMMRTWSDAPGAGTDTDEGGWERKTRRKRPIARKAAMPAEALTNHEEPAARRSYSR
ncbi:unnamed protein product, partial [Nesidiocoris tenuis]